MEGGKKKEMKLRRKNNKSSKDIKKLTKEGKKIMSK